MRKLVCSLFVVLLIVACKDNPVEPKNEFEPYRVGNWWLVSPTTAFHAGSKSKGDTLNIDGSESGYSLGIIEDTTNDRSTFNLIFIDSTTTMADSIGEVKINPPKGDALYDNGLQSTLSSDRYYIDIHMEYICGNNLTSNKLSYDYLKKDGSHYRTYTFDVQGILDVLDKFYPICH